ncbi:MAG TPA: carboxypeptidase regulatory-like domain-containing protein [Longimicrobium sp.]|nr:carboxypeptidase regulatory-like domain-containing protein [Longimicrobium sp.]
MMFHRMLVLAMAWASVSLTVRPAHAQIAGRVVTSAGQPVADARVEVWGPLRRLAVQQTDAEGAFVFAEDRASGTLGLVVSRIGYAGRSLSVTAGRSDVVVELSEAAIRIDGIAVEGSATPLCPGEDEAAARALWQSAAGRYSSPDTLFIRVELTNAVSEVRESEIGVVDERQLRRNGRGTGPQTRHVDPHIGYGFSIRQSSRVDFSGWQYMELGSHEAQHFIDPTFGTYNTLKIRARRQDATVLGFCSRNLARGVVGIEGTLTLGADSTLQSVVWRFRVPGNAQKAGGEVTFVPHPGRGHQPWLVPAVSLYWRSMVGRSGMFFQRWEQFDEWAVNPGWSRAK